VVGFNGVDVCFLIAKPQAASCAPRLFWPSADDHLSRAVIKRVPFVVRLLDRGSGRGRTPEPHSVGESRGRLIRHRPRRAYPGVLHIINRRIIITGGGASCRDVPVFHGRVLHRITAELRAALAPGQPDTAAPSSKPRRARYQAPTQGATYLEPAGRAGIYLTTGAYAVWRSLHR